MASVRRIAPRLPPSAARRRLGVVVASLGGGLAGLAGLAVGAACVVRAPDAAVGTAAGVMVSRSSGPGVGDRGRLPARDGVARVLAPARDAGVTATSGRDSEQGAP